MGPADPMVKRRRVGRRGPARRRRLPVSQRELDQRWLKSFYDSWGPPTPPTGRDVLKYAARRNEAHAKAEARTEKKAAVNTSFRRARVRRQARRRGRTRGEGQTAVLRQRSRPASRGRPQQGLATRGPATTLSPELAREVLKLRESGTTIAVIGKRVSRSPSTVAKWLRSGRAAARAETV